MKWTVCLPFHGLDALRRQLQDEESSIAHQAIVGCSRNSYAIIEEGAVFGGISLKALGDIL